MSRPSVGLAIVLAVSVLGAPAAAQMAHRLKGSIRSTAESAGKILWEARDLAPKDQRQALAAAIDDLRGIARVQ